MAVRSFQPSDRQYVDFYTRGTQQGARRLAVYYFLKLRFLFYYAAFCSSALFASRHRCLAVLRSFRLATFASCRHTKSPIR